VAAITQYARSVGFDRILGIVHIDGHSAIFQRKARLSKSGLK